MQAIKNKIRSRRGASLTFALLLFLVCAVVGSVVLVAGTAASGRMSQIAEMDQRYYSVNSAARLLIELMEKYEIRAQKKEAAAPESGDDNTDTEYIYLIDGKTEEQAKTDGLHYELALGIAKQLQEQEKKTGLTSNLTISPSTEAGSTEAEAKALKVSVTEKVTANGDVEFVVKNADDSDKQYQIMLRFMDTLGASSYQWKLYDIETVMPTSASEAGEGGTP